MMKDTRFTQQMNFFAWKCFTFADLSRRSIEGSFNGLNGAEVMFSSNDYVWTQANKWTGIVSEEGESSCFTHRNR